MISLLGVNLFFGAATCILGIAMVLWGLKGMGGPRMWRRFRGRPNRIARLIWGLSVMLSGIVYALGYPWWGSAWLPAGLPAGGSIALAVFGLVAPRFTAKVWTHSVDEEAARRLRIPVPSFEESVRNARVDGALLLAGWVSLFGHFGLASTGIISHPLLAEGGLLAVAVVLFAAAVTRRGMDYTIRAPRRAERTR